MLDMVEITKEVIKSCAGLSRAEMVAIMAADWFGEEKDFDAVDDIMGGNGWAIRCHPEDGSVSYTVEKPDIIAKAIFKPYKEDSICVEYYLYGDDYPMMEVWDYNALESLGIL